MYGIINLFIKTIININNDKITSSNFIFNLTRSEIIFENIIFWSWIIFNLEVEQVKSLNLVYSTFKELLEKYHVTLKFTWLSRDPPSIVGYHVTLQV